MALHPREQILLPCDYLKPPRSLVNRALSLSNLMAGLSMLKVPSQLFLIDACRSDHERLRSRGINLDGTPMLNSAAAAYVNSAINAQVIYATAMGQQAFQVTDPSRGCSLFGEALLEGLTRPPATTVSTRGIVRSVGTQPLAVYANGRVTELLVENCSSASQPIRLGREALDDLVVTEIDPNVALGPEMPTAEQIRKAALTRQIHDRCGAVRDAPVGSRRRRSCGRQRKLPGACRLGIAERRRSKCGRRPN
ncbi:MAG TPA: hypothetical protein VIU11_03745 [Nakamurella sp.]